ncbi:MAG: glycosyltransferase family 2 protein [Nanoarchaeota archaeon]|nr:glycosyltransferase family 2 protein [Nanoarchaeota archaeon]
MKLSIIIPTYNERDTILKILEKVYNVNINMEKEIVIVDDCSTDGTRDILKKSNIKDIKVFYHNKNKGKCDAIKTGLKHASGDLIIIQDADLEYDPEDYKKLLNPILNNEADVVYGSRFLNRPYKSFKKYKSFILSHYLGNKLLTLLTSLLYGYKITDMETCYKLFKKEIIKNIKLESKKFGFEPEITAKVLKKYEIKEVPINFYPRNFEHGKKITWRDGLKAFYYLVKYRL